MPNQDPASIIPLPDDVDTTGMEFMPLHIDRLMRSKTWRRARQFAGVGPGVGFALINMWCFALRERPAGSIEADEDDSALMDAAQVGPRDWAAMREVALKGWSLIDGRWYHPVVTEVAWKFWCDRLKARFEAAYDRYKRAARQAHEKGADAPLPIGTREEWIAREYPQTARRLGLLRDAPPCESAREGVQIENPGGANAECGDARGGAPRDCTQERGSANLEKLTVGALKGREGKEDAPLDPPQPSGGAKGLGNGNGGGADGPERRKEAGKAWFNGERTRLAMVFGEHAQLLQAHCGGPVKFVEIFRDLTFEAGDVGRLPVICASNHARLKQAKTILALSGIEVACFPKGVDFAVRRRRA